jgi:hypothetical protein
MSFRTVIKFLAFSMSVPHMQGFWEKYYPNAVRCGDFFQNPKGADLACEKERSLPLPKIYNRPEGRLGL